MIQEIGTSGGALEQEYRAGREATGLVTLARGTLEVSGPKRQDFLHAMLSNDVAGRRPGEGCRAASMTAKGSLQAFLRVLVDASVVVLETEQERLEPLLRTLEYHKVGAPVRFATRPVSVLGVLGPRASEALRAAGAAALPEGLESHREARVGEQPVRLVRAGDLPGGGFVLHAAPESASAVRDALLAADATPIGRQALDALRIEAFCPWYGSDVTEDNLLHETGLLDVMHSSTKGCYVGQEVIARLEGRGGNVNKALRGLRLGAAATPGTPVTAGGREIGWLTTCAVSPRLGPIALGYVHRSHFASGTQVEVNGASSRVVAAFDEAGALA
jgi:folate-binding protein YgfZ